MSPTDPLRRRRRRRATRAATGGEVVDPAAQGGADPTLDDTDAGWGESGDDPAHDRWLTEQRPPHWGDRRG